MTSLLGTRNHADISMRPNTDKEIEAVELDQLFNQYVETDLLQHFSDATADPSSSDDLSRLFELPSSNGNHPFETNALPDWDASADDAWHKAIQKLEEQNPASPIQNITSPSIYPESHGRASLSDSQLLNLDGLLQSSKVGPETHSQPSSPTPQVARPAKKARLSPDRSIRHGVKKLGKKLSLSTIAGKMMRPSQYRAGFQDIWTRKMDAAPEAFNLQIPAHGIHSPPPSTKLVQNQSSNGFFAREHQPYTIAMSPMPGDDTNTPELQHSNYQLTPLSSPAIDTSSRNNNTYQFSNDSIASAYISHHAALSALQTPPPSHRLPMSAWGSETTPNMDSSFFSASPDFQSASAKAAGWWNTAPVTQGQTQPSTPSTYHGSQSRSVNQSMSFSTASVAGLGISCDTASFSGFGEGLGGSGSALPGSSASFDMASYNAPLYTPGIPIGHGPANAPSRSPSLSPQPRFTRRRHSSNNPHHNTHYTSSRHSRRKSSNSSGASQSRNGSGSGNVGFVNFTPDDSKKILTGVAPSGSSKTKARREKEAADKRRKLSQAAVKAVMEAGGDLGRLEKEGLLYAEG